MTAARRILVLDRPITERELSELLGNPFDDMVKFVVDLRRRLVAFGGELHADAEALLLEQDCRQEDLWGGNYFPVRDTSSCIEFTSLINIRPAQGNRSIEVQDETLRARIASLLLERVGDVLGNREPVEAPTVAQDDHDAARRIAFGASA